MSTTDSTLTIEEDENRVEEFKQDMSEIRLATKEYGEVEATIISVTPSDDEVTVTFELPNGSVYEEAMEIPERATEDYKFVRLCREQGATIDTFDELLVGSTVEVDRTTTEEWEIKFQESKGWVERTLDNFRRPIAHDNGVEFNTGRKPLFIAGFLLFPLTCFVGAFVSYFGVAKEPTQLDYFTSGIFYGALSVTFLFTLLSVFLVF